jgi:hypothetical protein
MLCGSPYLLKRNAAGHPHTHVLMYGGWSHYRNILAHADADALRHSLPAPAAHRPSPQYAYIIHMLMRSIRKHMRAHTHPADVYSPRTTCSSCTSPQASKLVQLQAFLRLFFLAHKQKSTTCSSCTSPQASKLVLLQEGVQVSARPGEYMEYIGVCI